MHLTGKLLLEQMLRFAKAAAERGVRGEDVVNTEEDALKLMNELGLDELIAAAKAGSVRTE